ncbi:trimeric intracellular cation channel family protein [Bifidobacterium avesanii]|uniref:Trimeric intracellular cation channel family protein n=1 Tax=Bifidobacterium avesanii TaxID=1798157 RepID=A0A7K3TJ26_9BIFI|nr:TRIC cation channel family protein [Bifidobacterium avesanii]KAB8293600.1 hypothetical protein DSM100685_0668 [Bifidobacterium avesanii]NEG78263.1 trimeric intracellular cation channel family protein [Bifidobacterium avesanii]
MEVALETNAVFVGIEYLAIFVWGLSGGLSAVRKRYDLFSILTCAWMTALGGGLVRDTLLGDLPPVGITDKGYILTCLASGLVVAVAHPEIMRLKWTMVAIDALGLGLFAVNGTAKALAFGSSGMTAVFLGMATALAGGLFRDLMVGEVPMIIRDKHLYAVPSLIGCILTVIVYKIVRAGTVGMQWEMALDVVIVAVVFVLRMVSVACNLTFPGAVDRGGGASSGERSDGERSNGAGDK